MVSDGLAREVGEGRCGLSQFYLVHSYYLRMCAIRQDIEYSRPFTVRTC